MRKERQSQGSRFLYQSRRPPSFAFALRSQVTNSVLGSWNSVAWPMTSTQRNGWHMKKKTFNGMYRVRTYPVRITSCLSNRPLSSFFSRVKEVEAKKKKGSKCRQVLMSLQQFACPLLDIFFFLAGLRSTAAGPAGVLQLCPFAPCWALLQIGSIACSHTSHHPDIYTSTSSRQNRAGIQSDRIALMARTPSREWHFCCCLAKIVWRQSFRHECYQEDR